MKTLTLDLPAMYGDHHVLEVRRILAALAGVEDIYASSAFRALEVSYNPDQVSADQIEGALAEAGYAGDLGIAVEQYATGANGGAAPGSATSLEFQRHTAVYEQTRKVVGFAQNVQFQGRPLWPCPGVGVIRKMEE